MHYYYYREARDAAWKILRDTQTCRMPVSVLRICRKLGISVVYFSLCEGELGRSILYKGKPHILLYKDMSNEMKRFVCAHELGHILLNHFTEGAAHRYMDIDRRRGYENSADLFAMRLVCPACVLWGCGIHSTEEIAEICGIETDYAARRQRRMVTLYNRNKFLTSDLEREVYDNFASYISEYEAKRYDINGII